MSSRGSPGKGRGRHGRGRQTEGDRNPRHDPRRRPRSGHDRPPPRTRSHGAIRVRPGRAGFPRGPRARRGRIPGAINLAIALLNQTGREATSSPGTTVPGTRFDEALRMLDEVIVHAPENLQAHYCRGLILEGRASLPGPIWNTSSSPSATRTTGTPGCGSAAPCPIPWTATGRQARSRPRSSSISTPVRLECNPYLVNALYKLQAAYGWAGDREKQKEVIALATSSTRSTKRRGRATWPRPTYGAWGAMPVSSIRGPPPPSSSLPAWSPRFDPPVAIDVALPAGSRWANGRRFRGAARHPRPGPQRASARRSPHSTPTATAGSTSTSPPPSAGRRGSATPS